MYVQGDYFVTTRTEFFYCPSHRNQIHSYTLCDDRLAPYGHPRRARDDRSTENGRGGGESEFHVAADRRFPRPSWVPRSAPPRDGFRMHARIPDDHPTTLSLSFPFPAPCRRPFPGRRRRRRRECCSSWTTTRRTHTRALPPPRQPGTSRPIAVGVTFYLAKRARQPARAAAGRPARQPNDRGWRGQRRPASRGRFPYMAARSRGDGGPAASSRRVSFTSQTKYRLKRQ